MAKAKGVVLFGLVPLLFVAGAGVVSVKYMDSAGNRFFDEGKEILGDLTELSHAMKALERDIGCRLLDRLGKSVVLTQAGEQLLVHAEKILSEMTVAREELGHLGK